MANVDCEEVMKLLGQKDIFVISDYGWYYSKVLAIFFDETSAIRFWEEKTKLKWAETDYVKYATSPSSDSFQYQGHWYYAFDKVSLQEIISDYKKIIADKAVYKQTAEIVKQGNERIERQSCKETMEIVQERVAGLLYYLKENNLISSRYLDNISKLKENFHKYKENCN